MKFIITKKKSNMNEYMASDICSVEKDSCKLRLVHPFQCWCLSARGLHKHFKLKDYFKALKEKNRYANQRTKCYCPKCDNELCGSGSYLNLYNDINRLEYYKCSNCKEESSWDFDCICPLLVSHELIEGNYERRKQNNKI